MYIVYSPMANFSAIKAMTKQAVPRAPASHFPAFQAMPARSHATATLWLLLYQLLCHGERKQIQRKNMEMPPTTFYDGSCVFMF